MNASVEVVKNCLPSGRVERARNDNVRCRSVPRRRALDRGWIELHIVAAPHDEAAKYEGAVGPVAHRSGLDVTAAHDRGRLVDDADTCGHVDVVAAHEGAAVHHDDIAAAHGVRNVDVVAAPHREVTPTRGTGLEPHGSAGHEHDLQARLLISCGNDASRTRGGHGRVHGPSKSDEMAALRQVRDQCRHLVEVPRCKGSVLALLEFVEVEAPAGVGVLQDGDGGVPVEVADAHARLLVFSHAVHTNSREAGSSMRTQQRVEDGLPDACAGEQHHHAVDADAEAAHGWDAVLEGLDEVGVELHRLGVASGGQAATAR